MVDSKLKMKHSWIELDADPGFTKSMPGIETSRISVWTAALSSADDKLARSPSLHRRQIVHCRAQQYLANRVKPASMAWGVPAFFDRVPLHDELETPECL
jgi:hypothetical protein